jgi:DNA-binding response OmpR family regulator
MGRILLVEDELKVADAVSAGLRAEGYDVVQERTGEGGFFRASTETFDIILLDLGLPDRDGLEILSALRGNGMKEPVLIMTARDAVEDRVAGLDAGADDYMIKPFSFAELLARVRALIRRGAPAPGRLRAGDLVLDLLARTAQRAGRPLDLTVREFQVLECLMRHQGHVVTRENLRREIWQEAGHLVSADNVIDVHVGRLRKKIDADQRISLIHTVRAVGFMLSERPREENVARTTRTTSLD